MRTDDPDPDFEPDEPKRCKRKLCLLNKKAFKKMKADLSKAEEENRKLRLEINELKSKLESLTGGDKESDETANSNTAGTLPTVEETNVAVTHNLDSVSNDSSWPLLALHATCLHLSSRNFVSQFSMIKRTIEPLSTIKVPSKSWVRSMAL